MCVLGCVCGCVESVSGWGEASEASGGRSHATVSGSLRGFVYTYDDVAPTHLGEPEDGEELPGRHDRLVAHVRRPLAPPPPALLVGLLL